MRTVNLRQRYWIILGALLGLGTGWAANNIQPVDGLELRRPLSQPELLASLRSATTDGEPLATDITIYPESRGRTFVTGLVLSHTGSGYADKPFFSSLPSHLYMRSPNGDLHQYNSIREVVAEMAIRNPRLLYRYAWWRVPSVLIGSWCAIGILFLGIVWPLSFRLIAGARSEIQEVGFFELWQLSITRRKSASHPRAAFQSASSSPRSMKSPKPLTTEESESQSSASPLEATLPPDDSEAKQRRYRGEFYPVVAPKEREDK
jgi:hypothetical protein